MDFYYVNHKGKRIDLSDYPYLFQSGDILEWTYSYDTSEGERNQTSNFRKSVKEFSVKIAVLCDFLFHYRNGRKNGREQLII